MVHASYSVVGVVALFYYVRVISYIYLSPPIQEQRFSLNFLDLWAPVICLAGLIIFGLFPETYFAYLGPLASMLELSP